MTPDGLPVVGPGRRHRGSRGARRASPRSGCSRRPGSPGGSPRAIRARSPPSGSRDPSVRDGGRRGRRRASRRGRRRRTAHHGRQASATGSPASRSERTLAAGLPWTDELVVGWAEAQLEWTTSARDVGGLWAFVRPTPPPPRARRASSTRQPTSTSRASAPASLETWSSDEAGRSLPRRPGLQAGSRAARAPARACRGGPVRLRRSSREGGRGLLAGAARRGRPIGPRSSTRSTRARPPTFRRRSPRTTSATRTGSRTRSSTRSSRGRAASSCLPARSSVAFALLTSTRLRPRRQRDDRHARGASPARASRASRSSPRSLGAGGRASQPILTSTDGENTAMLGLNESLGYRPVGQETEVPPGGSTIDAVDPLLAPIEGADHREVGGATVDIVRAGNGRVKRAIYPPGFRWSTHMRPDGAERALHARPRRLPRARAHPGGVRGRLHVRVRRRRRSSRSSRATTPGSWATRRPSSSSSTPRRAPPAASGSRPSTATSLPGPCSSR